MINQLRTYEIFEETREAFLDRFRDHAARIMAGYGFRIVAMWESGEPGGLAFCYLLAWRDEAEMKAAWEAFMADEEWSAIKERTRPATGAIVGRIEDRVLRPTAFSAALTP